MERVFQAAYLLPWKLENIKNTIIATLVALKDHLTSERGAYLSLALGLVSCKVSNFSLTFLSLFHVQVVYLG